MDADEFWFAEDESLAEHLRMSNGDIAEARLHNLFPTIDHPVLHGLQGPLRFDHAPHVLRKTAVRAHPWVWLSMGNHAALRPGLTVGGLFVAHLPWRSEAQFVRKARQGSVALAAAEITDNRGEHWRAQAAMDDSTLHAMWLRLLQGVGTGEAGWHPVGPFAKVDASTWQIWPGSFPGSGT